MLLGGWRELVSCSWLTRTFVRLFLQRDAAQTLLTKPGDGAGENEERKKEDRV